MFEKLLLYDNQQPRFIDYPNMGVHFYIKVEAEENLYIVCYFEN